MDTSPGLTIPEAAAVLGCSPKTVRRRIAAGKLPAERISTPQGHVWLVHLEGHQLDRGALVSASSRQDAVLELTRIVASQVTESLSRRIEELVRENERLKQELELVRMAPRATEGSTGREWLSGPAPGAPSTTSGGEAVSRDDTGPMRRPWWRFW